MKDTLNPLFSTITILALLLFGGCKTSKNYVTESDFDYSSLETFKVKPVITANGLDPYSTTNAYKSLTKGSITKLLIENGFKDVDNNPDFTVSAVWWTTAETTADPIPLDNNNNQTRRANANIESTLEVSIVDNRTGKRVYRGWSKWPIRGYDMAILDIKRSVEESLAGFPSKKEAK